MIPSQKFSRSQAEATRILADEGKQLVVFAITSSTLLFSLLL